jgi:antitoxin (DNA-binding transcriptional repressor) of toxin-antitoxin stability system
VATAASGNYQTFVRSVGLRALKNKLSEYVRLAAGGETVLITDRDHIVAEIVPPHPGRCPFLIDAPAGRGGPRGLACATVARWQRPTAAQAGHDADLMQDLKQDTEDW